MYEGIFDDVEHVKEVLASHGHKLVDETLVFELLEDLKVRDHVVKVLLGTRLKCNSNWSNQLIVQSAVPGAIDSSVYLPDLVEDSTSSDDLEVLECNVKSKATHVGPSNEAVDLTMDDNHSSKVSEKFNNKEMETKSDKPEESFIDLTKEMMEVKEECCGNEDFRDGIEVKDEDADGNNSATESESEMDDYYRMPFMESEESEGFGESDEKVSLPASPGLGVCPDFDNQGNNEVLNMETGENRMEEMLEENNNDPNNNLEDIEELGQNNGAASTATVENLNIDKEFVEERCGSPKPGCSKDSYYADTDFCTTDDRVGDASDEKQKFIAGKRPNIANVCEDKDFFVGNCVGLSDTKIEQDVSVIQKIVPHFTKDRILSVVMENREAVNRVEIALWELLPDEKPAPVFHPKRKQAEDTCPALVKKFIDDDLECKKNSEAGLATELPKVEATGVGFKSGIIKPAMLKVSEAKKNILKPSRFEFPKSKSTIMLKPSKLEHFNSRIKPNVAAGEAKIPNSTSEAKFTFDIYGKAPSKDNKAAAASDAYEIGTISKRTKQTAPFVPSELEEKLKDSTELIIDYSAAAQKVGTRFGAAAAPCNLENVSKHQFSQITVANKEEDTSKSNVSETGVSPNKKRRTELLEKLQVPKDTRKLFPDIIVTDEKDSAQREVPVTFRNREETINYFLHTADPNHSKNSRLPLDQDVSITNDAATSRLGPLPAFPTIHTSQLNLNHQVPGAATASGSADVNPPRIENRDINYGWTGLPYKIQNHSNAKILQRVENIQLETQRFSSNGLFQNVEDSRMKDWLQPLLHLHPHPHPHPHPQPEPQAHAHNQLSHPLLPYPQPPQPQHQFHPQPPFHPQPQVHSEPLPVLQVDEILEELEAIPVVAIGAEQIEPGRIVKQEVPPPKELFNPLINMFPNVDPNYIAELCISAKSKNQALESLVELLLVNGVIYPRIINPEPEPQEMNPDIQYENLQGIFPEAHPEYLRGIAEQYYNDPEAMKNFVQAKLENPDYPTMADYLKKIKITEQIRQYTVDFSAEKFLQIFPKPLAHFENPKRVYRYNVIAFEFLKCHFRMNKVVTIQRIYKSSKHAFHISLAAKALEFIGPDMKTKRSDKPLPTEDIPLLQEFAFIKHKAEIEEYIALQELKDKQEFKRLKKNNELLECQCCYDGECMPSKCMTCSEGHVFCNSCIKTGSETKIGEGQTQFPCFVECKGEFTLPVLQKTLEPTMFSILLRKRQEEEVKAAGLEGLVSCPFCHFASIPPPEDKVFKCLNPECMKETCRLCKELNHVPLRCDEVTKGEEARHYLEEKMTEALVRKCYRCSRPFFKDEGCNKMTCPCGATTCYICGEPVKGYGHFNGQGSDRIDLCPMWSDNKVLNAQTVRVIAEAAEKEILKKNPHIKIDAKALMPSMPQASRGPHQDIANAHILPIHARRA